MKLLKILNFLAWSSGIAGVSIAATINSGNALTTNSKSVNTEINTNLNQDLATEKILTNAASINYQEQPLVRSVPKYEPIYFYDQKQAEYEFKIEYKLLFKGLIINTNPATIDLLRAPTQPRDELRGKLNANFALITNKGRRISFPSLQHEIWHPTLYGERETPVHLSYEDAITTQFILNEEDIANLAADEFIKDLYLFVDYSASGQDVYLDWSSVTLEKYNAQVKVGDKAYQLISFDEAINLEFPSSFSSKTIPLQGTYHYFLKDNMEISYLNEKILELDWIMMSQASFNELKAISNIFELQYKLSQLLKVNGQPIISSDIGGQSNYLINNNIQVGTNGENITFQICQNNGKYEWQTVSLDLWING